MPRWMAAGVELSNGLRGACSSVVEHSTFNRMAVGSNPTGLTNFLIAGKHFFFDKRDCFP